MHFVLRDRMYSLDVCMNIVNDVFDDLEREGEERGGGSRNCEDEIKKSLKYK